MQKILVAVDGSIPSIHAAKLAVQLAKGLGARVMLAHVTPPTVWPGDTALAPVTDLREAELAHGASVLKAVVATLEGEKVATLNLLGSPAEVLSDLAIDDGFDLVVCGNKGRGAVSRVLVGSVADRLVHICKKPVLVTR